MTGPAWLERALFGPVARGRVQVLERLVYALLAFDLWVEMAPHGSRYGAGGLNVAHFGWLDAIQGLPSAGTYLGVVFASGVLCLALAFGLGGRLARWAAFALYTYSWAMSQLDSYQHHVFLSIVLFHTALADDPPEADRASAADLGCAWPYQLLVAAVAVVYAYTGLSKTEEAWLMGDVLVRINASGGKLEPFLAWAQSAGVSAERFWWLGGHSVVLAQWIIVVGYLAVFLDPARRWRATSWLALCGLVTALAFHAGAEYLELRVGWFSYYMVLLALIMLGPAAPWSGLLRLGRSLDASVRDLLDRPGRWASWVALASVAVAAWSCSELVDLPSSAAVGVTGALLVLYASSRARARASLLWIGATGTAVIVFATLSLTHGTVHYDFYRFLGGDLVRRGHPIEALDAYGLANTWAPEGEGRQAKVRKIQSRLPVEVR